MDEAKASMNGSDEKTYILGEVSHSQTHEVPTKGLQLASELPEFHVSEHSGDSETPRLMQGAFQALGVTGEGDSTVEKSSLVFTSFNYINSIVGSGVIGMAYAFRQSGYGLGILLMIGIGIATEYSLILLIAAAEAVGVTTYQDLMKATFGRTGYFAQSLFQFLYPFISLISYNIIVGDTLTKVLIRVTGISPMSVLVKREFIITTSTLLLTIPISLYRNIARLARVSMISVGIIVGVGVSIVYRWYTMLEIVEPTADAWTFAKPNFASTIGILSFAFMCHHSSFLVYESLQDNTLLRWKKVTYASVTISLLVIATFAIAGYCTFTGYTQGDIFENYCWNDDLMNLCRGCYAVTILLTYPIECFVCREVLEKVFFSDYQPQPYFRHASLTVVIALIAFLFSLSTDCLGIVLQLNGLVCALPLAYILPPLCYIRATEGPLFCRGKYLAWTTVIAWLIVMLIGFVTLALTYDEITSCSHGHQMEYCTSHHNAS